jgi:hypothetical protein
LIGISMSRGMRSNRPMSARSLVHEAVGQHLAPRYHRLARFETRLELNQRPSHDGQDAA